MVEESVSHWIANLKKDEVDSVAQHRLWDLYFQRLVSLARSRLGDIPRRVADEEDVAAKVMQSFFWRLQDGQFSGLQDRDGLWPLLVKMTARKVANQIRDQTAQKRGVGLVRGESVWRNLDGAGIEQIIGDQPSPEFAVEFAEYSANLLERLEPALREVIQLKFEGFSNLEIAQQTNCSPRTIERRLQSIRTKLSEVME